MTTKYAQLENHIINLFKEEQKFEWENRVYHVIKVGKPRTKRGGGECKTDVYVLGQDEEGLKLELRLSVKSAISNEFQGNKYTDKSVEGLLGENWESIVTNTTESIADRFENVFLMNADKYQRTNPNGVVMGWKLEVSSKPRHLSALLALSDQEIRDRVYKGTELPPRLRDGVIDNQIIPESGIADFIIYTELEELDKVEDVIDQMILIDNLYIEKDSTYLIFTANNWYPETNKTDGKRYLAVTVKWNLIDGKLVPNLIFNQPLKLTGSENKFHVKQLFDELEISTPSQLEVNKQIDDKYIFVSK